MGSTHASSESRKRPLETPSLQKVGPAPKKVTVDKESFTPNCKKSKAHVYMLMYHLYRYQC